MKIFVGAGEASGDRILAALMRSLRARDPEVSFHGFGGPHAAAEGLIPCVPGLTPAALAVNGVGDVLRAAFRLLRLRARLSRELDAARPDRVLLVDYPGMNVALARRALRRGIPVHYVAPPQLWAYKNPHRRLRRLRAALAGASLQVLFPREAEAYAPWNGPLLQGHFFPVPAFEPARGTRLLLCPGGRRGVLRRNLPPWLDRVRAFFGTLEGVDVLVPDFLRDEARALCDAAARRAGDVGPRLLVDRDAAFATAGAAIAFPGTVTLELFLHRIPARAWALLDAPTLWAGRRALHGPFLALPSALAGEGLMSEWVGTARDFARRPPDLPARVADWNPAATAEAVHRVWTLLGAGDGAETGAVACRACPACGNGLKHPDGVRPFSGSARG